MSDSPCKPGWEERSLSSLAQYLNGRAFRKDEWGEEGLPIIRIEQINDLSTMNDRYEGSVLPRNQIDDGDLVFSWSATLKVVVWKGGPAALNQHLFKVVPNADVDGPFLKHFLDMNMERLAASSQGSTMKHVTRSALERHRACVPTKKIEQHRIARILSTVDEAIEGTEKLIAKHQQIKAGLMHDLFTRGLTPDGKLRPPHTECPSLYKDSPLGPIPKEWDLVELQHLLAGRPRNGFSPVEVSQWDGVYSLGLGCLTVNGFRPRQLKYVPEDSQSVKGALLHDGDFLLSRSNTRALVGLCGIYNDVGEPCIYPDLMMRLRTNGRLANELLEAILLTPLMRRQITAAAVGTSGSMVKLNASSVKSLDVAVPEEREQPMILSMVKSIQADLGCLEDDAEKLGEMKRGLMHDLLTGEVEVSLARDPEVTA